MIKITELKRACNEVVSRTFPEIKVYGNDTVEIVSGLQKGDRVVTAGVQKLHEGEEVRL